jgi:phosphoglycolate phosphatase-like HAD superfamily hydrolase
MIGDRSTDMEAAKSAGLKDFILVRTGDGKKTESQLEKGAATRIADNLEDAFNLYARDN